MLFDTGEKGSLFCSGRKIATLLPIVTQKVGNVPEDLGDLAKETSKAVLKVPSGFFLLLQVK